MASSRVHAMCLKGTDSGSSRCGQPGAVTVTTAHIFPRGCPCCPIRKKRKFDSAGIETPGNGAEPKGIQKGTNGDGGDRQRIA